MSIREKFLANADKFKKQTVEVEGIGKIEVKEPNAKQRADIYKNATVVKGVGKNQTTETDPSKLLAYAVIFCCYDPETGAKVFDLADLDTLLAMPGSWLDRIAKPALEFLGESDEDAEKNS